MTHNNHPLFNYIMQTSKRLLLSLCLTLSLGTYSQNTAKQTVSQPTTKITVDTQRIDSLLSRADTLLQLTNQWLEQIELDNSLKYRYKLYPTENIYTFLQLDTKTGKIEQVQWSLDSDKEGSFSINSRELNYGYGNGSNSFELYPTKNMYQFILLDKTTGNKWHVQWGMKSSERWIRRMY